MTGATAAAQYNIVTTPPVTVQLHDQTIEDIQVNATATATYTINSGGSVIASPGGTLETWLAGTGASSGNYEVMTTQTGGAAVSGTLGSWLNCGTSPAWTLVNSARNNSVLTAVLTVQIRDVATHTIQASASITLSAESDSRFG